MHTQKKTCWRVFWSNHQWKASTSSLKCSSRFSIVMTLWSALSLTRTLTWNNETTLSFLEGVKRLVKRQPQYQTRRIEGFGFSQLEISLDYSPLQSPSLKHSISHFLYFKNSYVFWRSRFHWRGFSLSGPLVYIIFHGWKLNYIQDNHLDSQPRKINRWCFLIRNLIPDLHQI